MNFTASPAITSAPASALFGDAYSNVWQQFTVTSQKLLSLNSQVLRTVIAETSSHVQRLLAVKSPVEFIMINTAEVQAGIDKALSYQQHVNDILLSSSKAEEQRGTVKTDSQQPETKESELKNEKTAAPHVIKPVVAHHNEEEKNSHPSHEEHNPSPLLNALLGNLDADHEEKPTKK